MKITAQLAVNNVNSTDDMKRFTGAALEQLATAINGNITFSDNISMRIVTFQFVSSGKEVGNGHGLGAVPIGYFIVGSDSATGAAIQIYDGITSNTTSSLYLRATGAGTVRVGVFI